MEQKNFKIDKTTRNIIIIFLGYLVLMLAIFLPGYLYKKGTLYIVSSSIKIKYKDGKWSNITDSNDYKLKKFSIYENDKYLGKYKILYADEYTLYYGDKKETYNSNKVFAYGGSKKIGIVDENLTNTISDFDKEIINKALVKEKINYNGNYSLFYKMSIDINNDDNDEYVYFISNYNNDTNEKFYMLFMYKNNEIYTIEKVLTDKAGIYDSRVFTPTKIIDFRKDGKYELLYIGNYPNGSNDDSCAKLYDLNKNKEIHNFCD